MSSKSTLLAILQQAEYDRADFTKWVQNHQQEEAKITPEKWTLKLRVISILSLLFFWLPLPTALLLALTMVQPIETLLRLSFYTPAMLKLRILQLRGMKVVAIAGSYAKTSTKHIVKHALGDELQVVVTPKSYNTLLGIAKVILGELPLSTQVFVVEMGEFNHGDIKALANLVNPDEVIITPLGRQHLERFGSVEAIADQMKDLVTHLSQDPKHILLAEENERFFGEYNLPLYGSSDHSKLQVIGTDVSKRGTDYKIKIGEQVLSGFLPLFGAHQVRNALVSIWLAQKLDIKPATIVSKLTTVPYIERRHQPHFAANNVVILDNSYNTNPDAAVASLQLLQQLATKDRALVITAGFTELGKQTHQIHEAFGKLLPTYTEYLGLVNSPWVHDIVKGFISAGGHKDHVMIGKDIDEAFAKAESFVKPNGVVLFEGGYREIYV